MKSVESSFGLCINVSSLLIKVFYSLQVSHVCRIQKRCESFFVLLIEPLNDLLLIVLLVNLVQTFLSLRLSTVQFYRVMNIKLNHIQVVFVCQFVQHVIVRFIKGMTGIKILMLSKELINLGEISTFKKYPFGLFLLLLRYHYGLNYRILRQYERI